MNPEKRWHKIAAAYLILQALAVFAWWILLFWWPESRVLFKPKAAPDFTLLAFALPDLILLIGAGIWAARCLIRNSKTALLPLSLHAGGAIYAALLCWGQWLLTGEAALSAICMTPCALVPLWFLWKLWREP